MSSPFAFELQFLLVKKVITHNFLEHVYVYRIAFYVVSLVTSEKKQLAACVEQDLCLGCSLVFA